MPRPLNWVRGEGTVRNQRWGLGDLEGLGMDCPGTPGCPGNNETGLPVIIDVQQQIADLWDSIFNLTPSQTMMENTPTGGNTLGQWVKNNSTMLLIGGVIGLFLFKRR